VILTESNKDSVINGGTGAIFNDKNFFYPQASGYLQRAMAKLREHDKKYRIVVFIDDLDRCTPEKALEILESIKSFFDIEGIIFVLALNYIRKRCRCVSGPNQVAPYRNTSS
jgi:hypothetical protein